jgi:hypothetical protein
VPHAGIARKLGFAVVLAVVMAVGATGVAQAASVAYVDKGEVWLASLDGAKKARLAGPVVNGSGETETWLDVAQSDGGRIVAVRNKPGRISNFSWFKIWEPDGTSTVEGPLNAPGGWALYVYPLGFDITANGSHLVYGYSNSSSCCPTTLARGTYVRPATNSVLNPIEISSQTHPSLFGSRIVSLEDSSAPRIVNVQDAGSGNPYTDAFTGWLDTTSVGADLEGVDAAANGRLVALGFEAWNGGTQTLGEIGVLAIQGVDQEPTFPAAVNCFLPVAGVARDASLSQDASAIAWQDGGGLKVAGTPTTAADPCVLRSGPVVVSPTGTHPSIGGANVDTFLPKAPPVSPGPPAPSGGGTSRAPVLTLPKRLSAKALARSRGVAVKVKVSGPGKVTIRGTVPARRLGRRGKPVLVASGSRAARAAGTLTVRLRLNATGRKRVRRLKGAKLTLRVKQGTRSATKVVKLR